MKSFLFETENHGLMAVAERFTLSYFQALKAFPKEQTNSNFPDFSKVSLMVPLVCSANCYGHWSNGIRSQVTILALERYGNDRYSDGDQGNSLSGERRAGHNRERRYQVWKLKTCRWINKLFQQRWAWRIQVERTLEFSKPIGVQTDANGKSFLLQISWFKTGGYCGVWIASLTYKILGRWFESIFNQVWCYENFSLEIWRSHPYTFPANQRLVLVVLEIPDTAWGGIGVVSCL